MRLLTELSLALGCGLLGLSVSAWNVAQRGTAATSLKIPGFMGAERWEEASARATAEEIPLLVYVGMDDPAFASLHDDLGSDEVLERALTRFVPVALFLDGAPEDRALAALLGAAAAPEFFVVEGDPARRQTSEERVDSTRLKPVTGSAFERFGLVSELWSIASGSPRAREVESSRLGGTEESSVNGLGTRFAQLCAIVRDFEPLTPPDAAPPLEEHLATEGIEPLRYIGWSLLGSWLEQCARRSSALEGAYLGVPSTRWEARLRRATRYAWISCPDDRLMPFGMLLIQRFARVPLDLDSLDRAFMAAVIRTLSEAPGADEFPAAAWLEEARAALPAK